LFGRRKKLNIANDPSFIKPVPSPVPQMSATSPSGSSIPSISTTQDIPAEPPEQFLKNGLNYLCLKT
jgi:hypothetical protein